MYTGSEYSGSPSRSPATPRRDKDNINNIFAKLDISEKISLSVNLSIPDKFYEVARALYIPVRSFLAGFTVSCFG